MLEKPDRVSSLLSATRKVCRPAQARDGYSFTKLQMLEEGHLAPEHTQVNHQLCQRVWKVLKGTLTPHTASLVHQQRHHQPLKREAKKAMTGTGKELILGYQLQLWGPTSEQSFLLQPVEVKRKENQRVIPVLMIRCFEPCFGGNSRLKVKSMENARWGQSPQRMCLYDCPLLAHLAFNC